MRSKASKTAAKKAYFARVQRSNFTASLRLEGFDVKPSDAKRDLPTRDSVIRAYRKKEAV